jgi:hypothetical protein
MRAWMLIGTVAAVLSSQVPSIEDSRTFVNRRMREVYGAKAPSDATFVTIRTEGGGGLAWTPVPKGQGKSSSKQSRPRDEALGKPETPLVSDGDLAEGVIIGERVNELYLDTSPCKGQIATFSKPFRKKLVGTVQCDGVSHQAYEVVQQ